MSHDHRQSQVAGMASSMSAEGPKMMAVRSDDGPEFYFPDEEGPIINRLRNQGMRSGPDFSITVDELHASFNEKIEIWQNSACCAKLQLMLERHEPEQGWDVRKAVCIAVGSFSILDERQIHRSMMQLVMFLDIIAAIENANDEPIKRLLQDPNLTTCDKEFLKEKGVTGLESWVGATHYDDERFEGVGLEKANEHFGPQTALFEFGIDMREDVVYDMVKANNVLHIGSSLLRRTNLHGVAIFEMNEYNSTEFRVEVERFLKEHRKRWLPKFDEEPEIISGMMIYWPEQQDFDLEDEDAWER